MRIDFIGVGFGRSGSNWLVNCLNEHPEISLPKFNLHTEINYFPEEYEVMGLWNYMKKFKNCDFEKVVGEISTLIIWQKRSAKLLKKLFPNVKIIIYQRDEKDRVKSSSNVAKNLDLVDDNSIRANPIEEINQQEYIQPWIDEFGKKQVFIVNMDNPNKQQEINKLFSFLNVSKFTPQSVDKRTNTSYSDPKNKIVKKENFPAIRKLINFLKKKLRKNPRLYYTFKRNLQLDYYYQLLNHKLRGE